MAKTRVKSSLFSSRCTVGWLDFLLIANFDLSYSFASFNMIQKDNCHNSFLILLKQICSRPFKFPFLTKIKTWKMPNFRYTVHCLCNLKRNILNSQNVLLLAQKSSKKRLGAASPLIKKKNYSILCKFLYKKLTHPTVKCTVVQWNV